MEKITIESLNINGEGLSFVNDKKYCVKNVLPGEEVVADVLYSKKNFVSAKLQEIVKPSSMRICEKCKYAGQCGGCDFMFISNENALKIKKDIIKDYFKDLFTGEIEVFSGKKDFAYRNKVSFLVSGEKIGLQIRQSNELVEVKNCIVCSDEINKALPILRSYLEKIHNSDINHIVVRTLLKNISITLVCQKKPKDLDFLIKNLRETFNDSFGLYLNYNDGKKKILSDKWELIFGGKALCGEYNGKTYSVQPYSFLQVNNEVMNMLYDEAGKEVEGGTVIEGYSGAGILSCAIAQKAKKVISIEINKIATKDANLNKVLANAFNIDNINGDCEKLLPEFINKYPNATFLIDPPRSGCADTILQVLLNSEIEKIIYISCNPYTLKQNLVKLKDKYEVVSFKIFNMFPQTFDVESMVILKKK